MRATTWTSVALAWTVLGGCEARLSSTDRPHAMVDAARHEPRGDGGSIAAPDPTPPGGDLPCGVEDALAASCRDCHGATPRFGAPMPLVTHADLHAPSLLDPTVPVWRRVQARIHDAMRPMPPAGRTLAAEHRAALEAWLAAGAPARTSGERCEDPAPAPRDEVGPDALPCTPSHVLRAHASGNPEAPYPVRVGADANLHTCFAFRNPFRAGQQATAWAPVIDEERVLHHWILWGSAEPPPGGADVFPCETLPHADASFVMGWAPGGVNEVLPGDVGLVLDHAWYYLQIHYYDAGASEPADRSGVAICTTDTPRDHPAGVLAIGTVDIDIPPRAREHVESFTCPGVLFTFVGEITILGSSPHMHRLGRRFRSEVLHADGRSTPLSVVDAWDFENQRGVSFDPPVRVRRGDEVRVRCVYDNPGSTRVRFGENTEDEMCFDFMLVYPITAWPEGIPRFCVEPGGLGL